MIRALLGLLQIAGFLRQQHQPSSSLASMQREEDLNLFSPPPKVIEQGLTHLVLPQSTGEYNTFQSLLTFPCFL